jgi:hypothetical protein
MFVAGACFVAAPAAMTSRFPGARSITYQAFV